MGVTIHCDVADSAPCHRICVVACADCSQHQQQHSVVDIASIAVETAWSCWLINLPCHGCATCSFLKHFVHCRRSLAGFTTLSFLSGAFCSGLAGYIGMWVSVRANVRVAGGARRSAREALQIAMRAGGFSALLVVGMVCIGIFKAIST